MLKVLVKHVSVLEDVQSLPVNNPRVKINEGVELCFESTEHLQAFVEAMQTILKVKQNADKYNSRKLAVDQYPHMARIGK